MPNLWGAADGRPPPVFLWGEGRSLAASGGGLGRCAFRADIPTGQCEIQGIACGNTGNWRGSAEGIVDGFAGLVVKYRCDAREKTCDCVKRALSIGNGRIQCVCRLKQDMPVNRRRRRKNFQDGKLRDFAVWQEKASEEWTRKQPADIENQRQQ